MRRTYNFSAGPAVLPESVLEEASRGILEIAESGMSVLEVSHRGPEYEAIHYEARSRVLRLLGLDEARYDCLFLGGGASLQFAMLPMNFLSSGQKASYVHTGEWSAKALREARRFGDVHIAGTSEETGFDRIPTDIRVVPGARYLHITTNNTIEGTEWPDLPEVGEVPLVADASSDIFGRARDHGRFALLYAGAQKNAGPAGVTLVIARKDFLATANQDLPAMLAYSTHAKADSLYNTPPVFAIYVLGLVMRWIEENGGIAAMHERNRRKAQMVYEALDAFPDVYEPTVAVREHRSWMNVTFRLKAAERERDFLAGAEARGMVGLKGHRSVGGFRASLYNAFPPDGCEVLAAYLRDFAAGRLA